MVKNMDIDEFLSLVQRTQLENHLRKYNKSALEIG
jgi:hypothetical protein